MRDLCKLAMDGNIWKHRSRSATVSDEDTWMYQFNPIIADKEIRLLKLEPATSFAEPLVGSLFVRTIDDHPTLEFPKPAFQCVSYCWGTQRDVQYMLCDSLHLPITQNVDIMLRHLRKALTPRNLWIDAICINQADETEKSHQVKAMGAIYGCADKVHVWLGPASIHDQILSVFAILRDLARKGRQVGLLYLQGIDMAPLNSFLMRPWFTRRWVLQEVKLARTVTVHCGHHRLSWDWIGDGIMILLDEFANYPNRLLNKAMAVETAQILEGMESLSFHSDRRTDILELLWKHHSRQCVDSNDRIFALYGMLPPVGSNDADIREGTHFDARNHHPIDYSVHFSATYTQLATAAVAQRRGLTILEHALTFGSLMHQNAEWPSWVPAWNTKRSTRSRQAIWNEGDEDRVRFVHVERSDCVVLRGEVFPITTIQVADEASDVMEFLEATTGSVQHRTGGVAEMLSDALEFAANFHDRQGLDFESIFRVPVVPTGDKKQSADVSFRRLLQCLEREFDTRPKNPDDRWYSSQDLRKEFGRVMHGMHLLRYRCGFTEAPAITFAKIKPGSYLFRLNGNHSPLPYSLVLQPNNIFSSPESRSNVFRLLGCCFDSETRQTAATGTDKQTHLETIVLR